MTGLNEQRRLRRLAHEQHQAVTRSQLLRIGFTRHAIDHRRAKGLLFDVYPGVYAVGHPDLTQHGRWMAAVLSCSEDALLSHESAAALWGIRPIDEGAGLHVSVTGGGGHSHDDVVVHRRKVLNRTRRDAIPVTTPTDTLIDIAAGASDVQIEAGINEAAMLGIATPGQVHRAAKAAGRRPGAAAIRRLLDRQVLLLTDSELERLFLRITRRGGLPDPRTRARVNGFRVDFFWPELGIVVETDGGTFHRTPAQQTRDRIRDQTHTRAGLIALRFTHAQVRYEPTYVGRVLGDVVRATRQRQPAAPARP